ncbi:MAG TPA: enoyl-CoA hydratase/isomerase family protein [Xanthobacteraceae bacterium]|jgi:enoyl-CoA hydratase/carnithine racemase|nr:enoyl-CoA hydratase/isomerase family protein [Xanthobacteraceae bacterium]
MNILHDINPDGIMVVTLNRPDRLNALDVPSKEQLGALWGDAAADARVRAIVLHGAGAKAFCAGSDIKEIQRTGAMVSTATLMQAIPGVGVDLDKPVVAALHGFTIGFGLTLAIHCDFRIAAPGSRFAFPEVQHGMLSGISAITLPGLVGEAVALDLMLSGRMLDDAEAEACGLINRVASDPFEAAMALARSLAANSPRAVSLTKQLVLADRKRRIAEFAGLVDRARTGVTDSAEYRDVVDKKPGSGRARAG